MPENFRIRLISQIRRKDSDNGIRGILKGILALILYPFILVFGLVIVFFGLVVSIFQKSNNRDNADLKATEETWTILAEVHGVTIWKKFKGEIRFGPAYFDIKTEPAIIGLENKIFGDWLYRRGQGIFLQQWNSTDNPDATLVYLDIEDRQVKTVQGSINSVLWNMVEQEDKKLELNCDTGDRILKYEVDM